jgi:hypothetical protein
VAPAPKAKKRGSGGLNKAQSVSESLILLCAVELPVEACIGQASAVPQPG